MRDRRRQGIESISTACLLLRASNNTDALLSLLSLSICVLLLARSQTDGCYCCYILSCLSGGCAPTPNRAPTPGMIGDDDNDEVGTGQEQEFKEDETRPGLLSPFESQC